MKKLLLLAIVVFCALGSKAETFNVREETHSPIAKAHFKLSTGYNMQTLVGYRRHNHKFKNCATFEAGFGTDIQFLQRARGLSLQLQGSYVMYSENWRSADAPIGGHDYGSANNIRIAAGPQYEFGHWPVRPLVRTGISYSFNLVNESNNHLHIYSGAGCAVDVGRHTLLLHADYWTNTDCKFFLAADYLF